MPEIDFIETDAQSIYETFISSLMDACDEALYPGDERRVYGEALVSLFVALYSKFNDSARQSLLRYARGTVLDEIGKRVGVKRLEAESAKAVFRFPVTATQKTAVTIPVGTRITTDGSVYFATTSVGVIPAGGSYVDIEAACTSGGSAHNGYTAGQISTIVDLIPYVSASNITASSGGNDGEPYDEDGDERLRERIRLAPSSFSTAGAESSYIYHTLSADPNIVDVAVLSPEAVVVNIYPLMIGGELPNEDTIAKVVSVLADDTRPMTDRVEVIAPTQVEYDIELKYYCERSDEATVVQYVESDGGAITQYVDWQCSKLGKTRRHINPEKLRQLIMQTGATRVEITSPVLTELEDNEVAKFSGNYTVTHAVEQMRG